MMSKKIDMTGWDMSERVEGSQLIVIKEAPKPITVKSKQSRTYWECKCKICGNIFVTNGIDIRNGHTKTCGCQTTKKKDLIGKTFNDLTVLYELPERKWNKIIYHCKCKCGNECDVDRWSLISGNIKSCGCKKLENISKLNFKDLTDQQFGHLTVLELVPERNADHRCQWLCQCICGNKITVSSHSLLSGNTVSCGCIKSIGESYISKILTENNYNFLYNKGYFSDLISDNSRVLRYDFIILKDNKPIRLIEFDGPQHIYETEFYGGKEQLKLTQKYDNLKNEYARTHNIPLVRIPYKERDHITLDLLMGDKYEIN